MPSTLFRDPRLAKGQISINAEDGVAITPDRLGDSVGRLSAVEMRGVDSALALVFGL